MTAEPEHPDRAPDYLKVLNVARLMATSCDLEELLDIVIQHSLELLSAERANLFLYDPERRELFSRMAAGRREVRFTIHEGLAGACVRDRRTILVADAHADGRFSPLIDGRSGFETRNLLAVPLRDFHGELVGVLEVLNKRRGAFGAQDAALVETLAAQAGVAIQRALLLDNYVARQQLEHGLQIARDVQQGLIPRQDPELDGWQIAGWNRPAEQTGGDTFDFMDMGLGRLGLLLADASGHGIGPALVVAQTRAMVRALSLFEAPVTRLVETVNNLLVEDLASGRFVTCFLGVLAGGVGRIQYVSAGQGPLLIYRAGATPSRHSAPPRCRWA